MDNTASFLDVDARRGPLIAAVRFDEKGRQCLRRALRTAAPAGQPVIALHILHETVRTLGLYCSQDGRKVLRPNSEVASRLLENFCAEIIAGESDGVGLDLQRLVVPGVPERRIVEVARLSGAELIVVGGPRKEGMGRLLRRDVTGAVMRDAPCPVLVVDADGNAVVEPPEQDQGRGAGAPPPAIQTS